jgi:hypothetical protein
MQPGLRNPGLFKRLMQVTMRQTRVRARQAEEYVLNKRIAILLQQMGKPAQCGIRVVHRALIVNRNIVNAP